MKGTIKATLQAMGEIELRDSAGDPIVYRRAILLMCETDDDVRAFAPLMGKGAVELRVETVEGRAAVQAYRDSWRGHKAAHVLRVEQMVEDGYGLAADIMAEIMGSDR